MTYSMYGGRSPAYCFMYKVQTFPNLHLSPLVSTNIHPIRSIPPIPSLHHTAFVSSGAQSIAIGHLYLGRLPNAAKAHSILLLPLFLLLLLMTFVVKERGCSL